MNDIKYSNHIIDVIIYSTALTIFTKSQPKGLLLKKTSDAIYKRPSYTTYTSIASRYLNYYTKKVHS